MTTEKNNSLDQVLYPTTKEAQSLNEPEVSCTEPLSEGVTHTGNEVFLANLHDVFFKATMTNLRMAQRFFEVNLPEHFKSRCDFSTLRLQPGSFVESNLRQHLSDILYAVQMEGQTGYLYCLLEHVSQAKPTTAFQLLRYQIAVMHQAIKQGHERPPVVVPILFYRGKQRPYPESCDLFDCFENPELARETLLTPHLLVDLSVIPDEQLATHKEIAMMEILEKHITVLDLRELVRYLVSPILRQYLSTEQFKSVVHYLEAAGYSHDYPAFFDEFNRTTHQPGDKTIMQTLGSYLRQEGMQQGIDQTNRKHIFKMKAKRYTNSEIAEIMDLSEADVVHCLEAVAH